MRRAQHGTIFDGLREETSRNGAWKSPSPQSERPIMESSFYAGMDTSGLGEVDTTGRSSQKFTGAVLNPQGFFRPPSDINDQLTDAGRTMNARAANPSRGVTPNSPLMRRN